MISKIRKKNAMITVRIKGGLGNQLFQYAAGYALSKRLEQPLALDNSFFPCQTLRGYKLGSLNITCKSITEQDDTIFRKCLKNRYVNKAVRKLHKTLIPCGGNTIYLIENGVGIIPEYYMDFEKNVYLDGYFQSQQYFLNYRKELIEQFTPGYEPDQKYIQWLRKIQDCNSVAVHVRRGDFLKAQNDSNPRHYLLGEYYYKQALRIMGERVKNPQFYWFSDDIDWVKRNFNELDESNFISLKTKNADIDEMMLMKNCQHIIAANSTFSWWSAWLNENENAIKMVPGKPYGIPEMIPEDWIKIPVE